MCSAETFHKVLHLGIALIDHVEIGNVCADDGERSYWLLKPNELCTSRTGAMLTFTLVTDVIVICCQSN